MTPQQIIVTGYGGHYYHNSWNDTWELHGVGARFGFEF